PDRSPEMVCAPLVVTGGAERVACAQSGVAVLGVASMTYCVPVGLAPAIVKVAFKMSDMSIVGGGVVCRAGTTGFVQAFWLVESLNCMLTVGSPLSGQLLPKRA